jgi:hypothetical protein
MHEAMSHNLLLKVSQLVQHVTDGMTHKTEQYSSVTEVRHCPPTVSEGIWSCGITALPISNRSALWDG